MRQQVETIRQELALPADEFRPLGTGEWQKLEEKIRQRFCTVTHPKRSGLLWNSFKADSVCLPYDGKEPLRHLRTLIPPAETVWMLLEDSAYSSKFWFYEGRAASILRVLLEVSGLNGVIIVSKDLEWLLCLEHHDNLLATGNKMPDHLRALLP